MRYKVTMQLSEEELAKLYNYDRITPIYQDVPRQCDIDYIRAYFKNGIICDVFYSEYAECFKNDAILRKTDFYKLVREITGTRPTVHRMDDEIVKNCFSR